MPCPTNTSVRTVLFFIDEVPCLGSELIRRVQWTRLFGPYFLGTLMFAGHGEGGDESDVGPMVGTLGEY